MESTLIAIYIALQIAPFVAVALALPYVVYEYIKTKSVNIWRSTYVYTFVLYSLCAYFMTMLPLPEPGSYSLTRPLNEMIQLIPFKNFFDIKAETWLRDVAIIAFNVVLTMPLGYLLRVLFNFDKKKILLIGFGAAMLFELTQLSGLFFIYPRPYRIFDIDDLMTNTLGALLGWYLVPWLSRFLPKISDSKDRCLVQGSEVSFFHRVIAGGIDFAAIIILVLLPISVVPALKEFLTGNSSLLRFPIFFLMIMAAAVLYTVLFRGYTPGYRLTGLRLNATGGHRAGTLRSVLRILLLYVFVLSIPFWILFFMSIYTDYAGVQSVIWMLIGTVLMLIAARNLLEMLFNAVTHGSSMFYDRVTGTSPGYGSSRKQPLFGIQVVDMQSLRTDTVDRLSQEVCNTLLENGVKGKSVTKVRLMAEGVLLDWIESGLADSMCELRLDRRFNKKALLLSVYGENKIKAGASDEYVTMLEGLNLSLETYYAAEKNICIIHIP